MPEFSIVLIAHNEETQLPRLLSNLEPFRAQGGEVLLVDTGSTDRTVELARSGGCRVDEVGDRFLTRLGAEDAVRIEARFARGDDTSLVAAGERFFDFGSARQYALGLARNDWVFQPDASDELLVFDLETIERVITGGRVSRLGYAIKLGGCTFRASRFFKRHHAAWSGRVHEVPFDDPNVCLGTYECTDGELLVVHHRNERKHRAYLPGLALDALDDSNPRWLHYLGRELMLQNRMRSALDALCAHAAREDAWIAERSESLCLAGACQEALNNPRAAEDSYLIAAALDPSRRAPWLRLGALRLKLGQLREGADAARRALLISDRPCFAEPDANYGAAPHALLYWCLFWLGDHVEARQHWEICLRLDPDGTASPTHARLFPT